MWEAFSGPELLLREASQFQHGGSGVHHHGEARVLTVPPCRERRCFTAANTIPSSKPEDPSRDGESPEAPFSAFAPVPRPLSCWPEQDLRPSHVAATLGERHFVSMAGSLAFVLSFGILDPSTTAGHSSPSDKRFLTTAICFRVCVSGVAGSLYASMSTNITRHQVARCFTTGPDAQNSSRVAPPEPNSSKTHSS